jgi:hypothetical protein
MARSGSRGRSENVDATANQNEIPEAEQDSERERTERMIRQMLNNRPELLQYVAEKFSSGAIEEIRQQRIAAREAKYADAVVEMN